jgi:phosphate-selective porin OprO and OprP
MRFYSRFRIFSLLFVSLSFASSAFALDKAELAQLLKQKGLITQQEFDKLGDSLSLEQLLSEKGLINRDELKLLEKQSEPSNVATASSLVQDKIAQDVYQRISNEKDDQGVKIGFGSKGLYVKSNDGNWATNLQWRAQMRYTDPLRSDPRQASDFINPNQSNFEFRRARMKIGGHGYQPWIKYYFELDLQPSRKSTDSSSKSGTRLIDWRITLDKYDWLSFRVGQWKINYNRERVDSSGRQSFVERSIVNRIFSVDRQVGAMAFGRLAAGTLADTRYYFGVFNGEGRSVNNDDNGMMYMGRLQWNFLGRDLKWRQSDVSFSEEAAGSLAFATARTTGKCTRWSSSGCGNLDGFESVSAAAKGQYEIDQNVVETAFKWRGFAWQQELHNKTVTDRVNNTESDFKGGYAQVGYFFHNLVKSVPENMEFAIRYAFVDEPNKADIALTNTRKEYTSAVNYFINGHSNKLTLDFSHLTLDDAFLTQKQSENRVRFQWDVSF